MCKSGVSKVLFCSQFHNVAFGQSDSAMINVSIYLKVLFLFKSSFVFLKKKGSYVLLVHIMLNGV
jgi:hypothetical protein